MDDEHFMQIAIDEALTAGIETWKNPRVGAVVVKNNQVLSRGHTHEYGGIHAEKDAIRKVSREKLKGATLYVTLEPCNHYGKQPPCTQAIIDAEIERVVIAETDPHKLVTGKGITALQEKNITVKTGVLEDTARKLNPHYDFFYHHQRPWITLKQAVSLDYRVAASQGRRTAITNAQVSEFVHTERSNFQGILIGSQTAIIDNPTLLTTISSDFPPVRIVLDRRGRLINYPTLNLLTDKRAVTWIFTENSELQGKFNENVDIFFQQKWTIEDIIQKLGYEGLQSIYVEGGPSVHHAFLRQNLVEELITYVAPQLIGKGGVMGMQSDGQVSFTEQDIKVIGNNIRIVERKIENV
ncbi:bifunctional diaminohydroxyphosphoribosylaminopyrimidine deaminase/5-amino-6-(5-phosphoribosylamino)uracil reductase RibD [uncultured Limosilactobacillus sp.]|uniref:bifunctional diaminohydroxyphosphoribosylaminopyrimidine deaminase/5-amino-6-(5-phosphoribosylamino)uracil reductase RibD n=1 Tax=uncultured Limosilactobacillus sp. TaxID=2837629 RepID=UPI00265DAADA|nr:bifunctional diaminohydroxyphosphoribosylaminopyrimidine deaminase/5-amino-6-(5-phosphoribosylamino)uracil reductase RibD [uncultured Limosilactobacillus sp.]